VLVFTDDQGWADTSVQMMAVDAETVDDMRSARETELRSHIARAQREIEQLQQRVREAADAEEKQKFQRELMNRQKQMHNHQAAMGRLQNARKRTAW